MKVPDSWWRTAARLLLVLSPFLLFLLFLLVDRLFLSGP